MLPFILKLKLLLLLTITLLFSGYRVASAQSCTGSYNYSYNLFTCTKDLVTHVNTCVGQSFPGKATCGYLANVCSACRNCGEDCINGTTTASCNITYNCPGGGGCGLGYSQDTGGCNIVGLPTPNPTKTPCTQYCRDCGSNALCRSCDPATDPQCTTCGQCNQVLNPPVVQPAALAFIDSDRDGDFKPSLGEKLIGAPGLITTYGGNVATCATTENSLIKPLTGLSFSSPAGPLSPLCYFHENSIGAHDINDNPYSTCGSTRTGNCQAGCDGDDPKNYFIIDDPLYCTAATQNATCYTPCSCIGNQCGFATASGVNISDSAASIGGILSRIPNTFPPGNFHRYLNAPYNGTIWLSTSGLANMAATISSIPNGYQITSAKYYQKLWGSVQLVTICAPPTDCSLVTTINFTGAGATATGMSDTFNPGQKWYAVAIWALAPIKPTCTAILQPISWPGVKGSTKDFLASCNTISANTTIDEVDFSTDDAIVAPLSPAIDLTSPYSSTVTAANYGSTFIHAKIYLTNPALSHYLCDTCEAISTVTVTDVGAWWQVKDGDVLSKGDFFATVPSVTSVPPTCTGTNCYFMLTGPGGFSGIPIFGTTAYFGRDSTGKTPSALGWLSNSATTYSQYIPTDSDFTTKIPYGYNFIKSLAPQCIFYQNCPSNNNSGNNKYYFTDGSTINNGNIVSGYASGGYSWFYIDGSATIDQQISLNGNRKAVIIVKNNLTIGNNINFNDGQAFIAFIVGGNINISPIIKTNKDSPGAVSCADYTDLTSCTPTLEGIYMADGTISTGTNSPTADYQLRVRGMLLGWSGISLLRDLKDPGNRTLPSEFIQYAPDLQFNYPSQLQVSPLQWKEVAP